MEPWVTAKKPSRQRRRDDLLSERGTSQRATQPQQNQQTTQQTTMPALPKVPPSKPLPPLPYHGPQHDLDVGVRTNSPLSSKTQHTISGSKRSSSTSRQESAEVLSESPSDAAGKVLHAITNGQAGLKAFEKVAFAIAGQDGMELRNAYGSASGGRDLLADLTTAFDGNPGPRAADYLLDCVTHDGLPSLRARMWVVFGAVDRSGSVARALAKIPVLGDKLGNAGDAKRVQELFEQADPQERIDAWMDPKLNKAIRKLDSDVHTRIQLLLDVEDAENRLAQADPANNVTEKEALAIARDAQLAHMVEMHLSTLPGTDKIVTLVDKIGGSRLGRQKWQYQGFDAKKFHDDLLDWKTKATSDDVARVQRPDSKFNKAMKLVPRNALTGLTKSERKFIFELSGGATSGGTQAQVLSVQQSLERQKRFVDRGGDTGSYLGTRLQTMIAGKKWRDVATEIKLLSTEQRKAMLDDYDADPRRAIQRLEADLLRAGFDKEARAATIARFNTDFGDIGANYGELWTIVNPGKTTQLKTFASHLKPTKWKKLDQALSGDARGERALKVIYELEDNEFALVRQDRKLLDAIRACSTDKTWAKILDALGMQRIDDQLDTTGSTRELVHQARLQGEANPKRWALQLADAIAEETVLSGVSAGRDKAQLYTIADRAKNAARLKAREDGSDPVTFLNECLVELSTMKRGTERVEYLRKRVPQVYAVFKENKPIPVEDRIKRAKHEGFGLGSLRSVDRQKLQWSFATLSGRELLDQWSNLHEFEDMYEQLGEVEGKLDQATTTLSGISDNPSQDEQERLEQANRDVAAYSDLAADLWERMNTFTLGIKQERRADLKKVGVKAEDRVQFEAMVSDRLADAMESDMEVQAILDEIGMPYDDFMRAKMKGVDALEMQRYLDSTRQWHLFSTKTSELSEATRRVKGQALSTEQQLGKARSSGKSKEDIAELREQGAERTEEALSDRALIEARFRDMQATFRQRAMVLFKVIVAAIVTGIVTAATWGAGAPLAIGLHVALEVGFNAMQIAYQYFVLGERDKKHLAATFLLGVLESTVRILTANLAAGLNVSLLHPANLPTGLDWVPPVLGKSMARIVSSAVTFAPKHVVDQAFHDKDLQKVIEEGEDTIADKALEELGNQTKSFARRMLLGAAKQGLVPLNQGPTSSAPPQKSFGQAMTDRFAGGGSQQEQEAMWGKYEKQKQKGAKREAMKMVRDGAVTKRTDDAESDQRKQHVKELRDRAPKNPVYETVKGALLNETDRLAFRKARGTTFLQLLTKKGISVIMLASLSDDEKGKVEVELHMSPGQLDREIRLSPTATSCIAMLAPLGGSVDATVLTQLLPAHGLTANELLRLPRWELTQVALGTGLDVDDLAAALRSAAAKAMLDLRAQLARPLPPLPSPSSTRTPPNKPLPPVPTSTSRRTPPNRPLPALPSS